MVLADTAFDSVEFLKAMRKHRLIEDPIVAEIHQYRKEHAAAYKHDLRQIVMALREREHTSKRLVLNPGPKYLVQKSES